jgi:hypothetical protein
LIFIYIYGMIADMKSKRVEYELSQAQTTLPVFLVSYNESVPAGFPRASVAALQKFRSDHQALFKHGSHWSIALHRKRVMDWLSSNQQLV